MPSASEGQEDNWARYFNKVLFTLTRTENLTTNLAVMAADARGFCEELGKKSSSKARSVLIISRSAPHQPILIFLVLSGRS
jgi:hypothetical protein